MLTLAPKTSQTVVLEIATDTIGTFEEIHTCYEVPKKKKKQKSLQLFCNIISANVIQPNLDLSTKSIKFEWNYTQEQIPTPITKTITIKYTSSPSFQTRSIKNGARNPTTLATTLSLKCEDPFYCDTEALVLESGAEKWVNVTFDPSSCITDNHSKKFKSKLEICDCSEKKDTVKLLGFINRPWIHLEMDKVPLKFKISVLC